MEKIKKFLKTYNGRAIFGFIILPYALNFWMILGHGIFNHAAMLIVGPFLCLVAIGIKNVFLKTSKVAKKKINSYKIKKKDLPEYIPTSQSETNQSKPAKKNDNIPRGITSLEKLKELKDKGLISDKNAKEIQKKLLDKLI